MQLLTLGVNHVTADVSLRERLSFAPESIPSALHQLTQETPTQEAVIVSTCNRTELYCNLEDSEAPVVDWLSRYHNVSRDLLNDCLYTHAYYDSARHLMRVASGLDSMVLGEPQILGQLKDAYQAAQQAGTLGALLNRLFQQSFNVAKKVRTDTAIGESPVSVAFAAVRLAQQIFGRLENHTALLVGAGDTIELAARHLHEKGLGRMIIANRSLPRARKLAVQFDAYAITLPEIPAHLAEADVVISSTASQDPVIRYDTVKSAVKTRRHRPMFMVDIAVPRDIEAEVGQLEDIYLYSVDDLNEVIQENMRSRREAAQQAEELIDQQVAHFIGWLQSRNAVGAIQELRSRTDQACETLLEKSKRMIAAGKSPEEVLEYFGHALTKQFLHTPLTQLREASYQGQDDLLIATRQLFQLKETEANESVDTHQTGNAD